MFKIGINSAPRITAPEVTETQESQQQNVQEQIAPPPAKSVSPANSSIRSEAMFSEMALRTQLNEQLSRNRGIGQKLAMTEAESEKQISIKPLYPTLSTGDGDDQVDIRMGDDRRVHIYVNGKSAWSGEYEEFEALKINTGGGNDHIRNYIDGASINTGDGNDVVMNYANNATIESGDGNDAVTSYGSQNRIQTGDGNDSVVLRDNISNKPNPSNIFSLLGPPNYNNNNYIDTGAGDDNVELQEHAYGNTIKSGDGDDSIRLGQDSEYNTIHTGEGTDTVEDEGKQNRKF